MIEPENGDISIKRQCEILGIPRSSAYYASRRDVKTDEELKRVLDAEYTKTPFFGIKRMAVRMRDMGYKVGEKRVRRLMREMGLMAVYPKKRTSIPDNAHRKYPYLLKDVEVEHPDHVWCTDITYIRLKQGFAYLMAILDWHSRYVVGWELSTTMEASFCADTLRNALSLGKPAIFNTDQGSQFTSGTFTDVLKDAGIEISMDGRGRVFDNIFVERFWRTVKYEDVYMRGYETVNEARKGLERYFEFYNYERPHQSLGYRTPWQAYVGSDGAAAAGRCAPDATRFGLRPTLVASDPGKGAEDRKKFHFKNL